MTKVILGHAGNAVGGLQSIGVGIASIFLLFVIFQCVTSILDGGRFQLKMLLPLVIYFLICNFSLVTKPVTAFTGTLQGACVGACNGSEQAMLKEMTDGAYGDDNINMWQAFETRNINKSRLDHSIEKYSSIEKHLVDAPEYRSSRSSDWAAAHDNYGSNDYSPTDSEQEVETEAVRRDRDQGMITKAINKATDNVKTQIADDLAPAEVKNSDNNNLKNWVLRIIAFIFQWTCDIVAFMVSGMGAVLTGVIVAFGPITWAFAVFPGNGRYILSWFIRLCQFSLYSPIVALTKAFGVSLMYDFSVRGGDSALAYLSFFGVMACIIVILTCVPTIASMIIEGASGAVSLSSGLQTIGSAIGAATGVALAPVRGATWIQSILERRSNLRRNEAEAKSRSNSSNSQNTNSSSGPSGQNTGPAN